MPAFSACWSRLSSTGAGAAEREKKGRKIEGGKRGKKRIKWSSQACSSRLSSTATLAGERGGGERGKIKQGNKAGGQERKTKRERGGERAEK